MAVGKTLLTPRHSLNAYSEPSPGRTLELVKQARANCQFFSYSSRRKFEQLLCPDRFRCLILVKGYDVLNLPIRVKHWLPNNEVFDYDNNDL